jgi:hypothetical protein
MLNVDQAFDAFVSKGETAGMSVDESRPVRNRRVAKLRREGGELRLTWEPEKANVSLEISHGPPGGPNVGWLPLWEETCVGGVLPDELEPGQGFEDALAYGLELMGVAAT